MRRFVIVTDRPDNFAGLDATINKRANGATVVCCENGPVVLRSVEQSAPVVVVVDEEMAAVSVPVFLHRLLAVNASINTAVASSRNPGDFHEAYEGLGVLMQLPPIPDSAAAEKLITRLDELGA